MASSDARVFVGTVGEGLYISDDGGATFKRPANNGLYIEGEVRALAAHPGNPSRIYAGTHAGVYRSDDAGDNWQRLDSAMNDMAVWALMVLPGEPDTVFAGTRPAGVYRSTDGGDTWHDAQLGARVDCPVIEFNRITTILPDPIAPRSLWVGVEIDGAWRSDDAGDTWSRHADGLSSLDVHGLVVVPENGARALVAATNNGVNSSADEGASWQRQDLSAVTPWNYFRGIRQQAGRPDILATGSPDRPGGTAIAGPARTGSAWRCRATVWERHPCRRPRPRVRLQLLGRAVPLRRSAAWDKLGQEFGEIRALMWTRGIAAAKSWRAWRVPVLRAQLDHLGTGTTPPGAPPTAQVIEL